MTRARPTPEDRPMTHDPTRLRHLAYSGDAAAAAEYMRLLERLGMRWCAVPDLSVGQWREDRMSPSLCAWGPYPPPRHRMFGVCVGERRNHKWSCSDCRSARLPRVYRDADTPCPPPHGGCVANP